MGVVIMAESNCRVCRHFVDVNQAVGTCRRYPHYQNRSPNEICGEFAEKAILPSLTGGVFSMMNLPVVDIPQVSKKKGRPRKND
jgi:hypothetical protein